MLLALESPERRQSGWGDRARGHLSSRPPEGVGSAPRGPTVTNSAVLLALGTRMRVVTLPLSHSAPATRSPTSSRTA